jgi:hypothetical protein
MEPVPMTGIEITPAAPSSPEQLPISKYVTKRIVFQHSDHECSTVFPSDDIDFVTMHNVLYFLYTGRVNLHFRHVRGHILPGYPQKADAFNLFCAADFYCLQTLQDRCFQYLLATMTPNNICSRLFDKRYGLYKELKDKYVTFLLQHYNKVKTKDDWKSLFVDWGEESMIEEGKHRGEVLLDITRRLNSE